MKTGDLVTIVAGARIEELQHGQWPDKLPQPQPFMITLDVTFKIAIATAIPQCLVVGHHTDGRAIVRLQDGDLCYVDEHSLRIE